MAESAIIKVKGDGSIAFNDNASGYTYTISYEDGDLQITPGGRGVNVFLDRGRFGSTPSIRYGDDAESTFTFSANFRDLGIDTGVETLVDVLQWLMGSTATTYVNSNWVPIGGASQEVNSCGITWTVEGSDHGDGADHTAVLSPCVCTYSIAEGDPGRITITGRAFTPFPVTT